MTHISSLTKHWFCVMAPTFDSATAHLFISEREVNGNATDGAILLFAESVTSASGTRDAKSQIFQIPSNSKN